MSEFDIMQRRCENPLCVSLWFEGNLPDKHENAGGQAVGYAALHPPYFLKVRLSAASDKLLQDENRILEFVLAIKERITVGVHCAHGVGRVSGHGIG